MQKGVVGLQTGFHDPKKGGADVGLKYGEHVITSCSFEPTLAPMFSGSC